MLKRIVAILLLVCMLPFTASAVTIKGFADKIASQNKNLPSFNAYMGSYASAGTTQTKDYLIYRKYSSKPSNIAAIAGQYVNLLDEQYGFDLIETLWMDFGTYARVTFVLTRDVSYSVSSFNISNSDDEAYWESASGNVILQYTVPDSGSAYIHFYYAPEFVYKDLGDRYIPAYKGATVDTESSATQ